MSAWRAESLNLSFDARCFFLPINKTICESDLAPVRLEITTFRLYDWRCAYCATEVWYWPLYDHSYWGVMYIVARFRKSFKTEITGWTKNKNILPWLCAVVTRIRTWARNIGTDHYTITAIEEWCTLLHLQENISGQKLLAAQKNRLPPLPWQTEWCDVIVACKRKYFRTDIN